eukprot:CAMPEP_0202731254 /NCGR_PEP_ID=MMETSP1385-20130828/187054_1 /ASSEMBLY_ACC=CAM_ASM_000861 /TAXON_ID=933848 /ORGANISM="Elphidium margaritaceum" /LENGTH=1201 /DNA_ID=CAMNT_0049397547 /DNA_START=241 /DNA_END=3846 /DNA_ORIENTATION=-
MSVCLDAQFIDVSESDTFVIAPNSDYPIIIQPNNSYNINPCNASYSTISVTLSCSISTVVDAFSSTGTFSLSTDSSATTTTTATITTTTSTSTTTTSASATEKAVATVTSAYTHAPTNASNVTTVEESNDWSQTHKTLSNTIRAWWEASVEYITFADRLYYFSVPVILLFCVCVCCCAAFCSEISQDMSERVRMKNTGDDNHDAEHADDEERTVLVAINDVNDVTDVCSEGDEHAQSGNNVTVSAAERGELVFQTKWVTQEQMLFIGNSCCDKLPKFLFGDNVTDRFRENGVPRKYFGGQARVMGKFDRLFAYGITTTFPSSDPPVTVREFKRLMGEQFTPLQNFLLQGRDVVIPKPSKRDIDTNTNTYLQHGKQVIFHNIGTGIASLPLTHLLCIQEHIDVLRAFAKTTRTVGYYKYVPPPVSALSVQSDRAASGNVIGQAQPNICCPLCTRPRHYLIHLKNCKHTVCEVCLRSYIHECLVYSDNPMKHRFKCWAAAIGNCTSGQLCIEDIEYAADRCTCAQCKKDNTDAGTGTILDMQPYHQFRNVMQAMKAKKWDKDECPECSKPFKLEKPWTASSEPQYLREKSYRSKALDHCNCCGQSAKVNDDEDDDDDGKDDYKGAAAAEEEEDEEEEEEVATTAYTGFNHCNICKNFYCDRCRRNCFYLIDQKYTIMPPEPVQEAIIEFNREQILRQQSMMNVAPNVSAPVFECCEICWFRYYCHECPHCQLCFCAMCRSKWDGCTKDWNEKKLMMHARRDDDDNKMLAIDEKHGHHNESGKHSCEKARAKIVDIERRRKAQNEQKKHQVILELTKAKNEATYTIKQQQMLLEKRRKELQAAETQLAVWKSKALEKQNTQLEKEKNAQQIRLKQEVSDKEQFRQIAEEEKKKAVEYGEENEKLKAKIGYVYQWQWNDSGTVWKSYDYGTNKALEALNINGNYTFACGANNQTYKITKLSSDKGTQINTKTNVSRPARRTKIERKLNGTEYPEWWNQEGIIEGTEPGSTSDHTYAKPKLETLDMTKSPAKDVIQRFNQTGMSARRQFRVIKVESVENQMLFDQYSNIRSIIQKRVGKDNLNERDLFHGTKDENVMSTVQQEGFRKEFNQTAAYGKGTYFARDASYSVSFSACNDSGVYKMFQCKVICGQSHIGNRNFELKSWPKKADGFIYDSLVNNVANPSIYVIHDDARVYPMFVIHFMSVK